MGSLPERSAGTARRGGAARLRAAVVISLWMVPLTVLFGLLNVSGAEAVVTHLQNGHTVSYQPLRGSFATGILPFDQILSNVEYDGGPVMSSNTNYAFYWDPPGAPSYPGEYTEGIDQYFTDLAHDSGGDENVDSVAAQYGDAEGEFASYDSHFAEPIVDEEKYPPNGCSEAPICLTDEQIQSELKRYIAANNLPHDLAHEYFVITPPGVENCFEANGAECAAGAGNPAYCAYHSDIPLAEGEIVYANDPYVSENPECDDRNHPNGPSDGALEGGLVHEHDESITDPLPASGWLDFTHEAEVADKCRTFHSASEFGTPLGTAQDGAKYNQVINGHLYWYQQMWSNQGRACLQRLTPSASRPIASFSSEPGSGEQMNFDASASTAPGGVAHYDWQFGGGTEGLLEAPVESSGPTMTHTFNSPGAHTVALTVYDSEGASGATARRILVGAQGPTAALEVTPGLPNPGQSVSFDASLSTPGQGSIEGYRWVFGDGSPPATGAKPSHSYAAVGNYMATVTVTDSSGQTVSLSREVAVRNTQSVTISSAAPASATVGGTPYAVEASATSGLPLTLVIAPESSAVCSVSGSTVSFTGIGTCTIDAKQEGNGTYFPAAQQQSFTVARGSQSINFLSAAPVNAMVGGSYLVEASASSGLPVSLAIAPQSASVCTLAGTTVSFAATGTCTIEASQAGNESYFPAAQAEQSFSVTPRQVSPPSTTTSSTATTAVTATVATTTTTTTSATTPAPPTFVLIGKPRLNRAGNALLWTARASSAGTVRWRLLFDNADVGFVDRVSRALVAAEFGLARALATFGHTTTAASRAERGARPGCRAGFVKKRGRCRRLHVPLAEGSQAAQAGQGTITVALNAKAQSALRAGRTLHLSGTVSIQFANGSAVTDRVTAVLHRSRRRTAAAPGH